MDPALCLSRVLSNIKMSRHGYRKKVLGKIPGASVNTNNFMKETLRGNLFKIYFWRRNFVKFSHVLANFTKTSSFLPYILHKHESIDSALWVIILERKVSHDYLNLLESIVVLKIWKISVHCEA